jgi:Uma2 family endonuclease
LRHRQRRSGRRRSNPDIRTREFFNHHAPCCRRAGGDTPPRQASRLLFLALLAFAERIGGDVFYAPLRVQVRPGKFRERDLLLVLDKDDPRAQDEFWLGTDRVMEIVSPDTPARDPQEKPRDYAEANIPENWIVNPLDATITVLVLQGDAYTTAGVFQRRDRAKSRLLDGFSVSVDESWQYGSEKSAGAAQPGRVYWPHDAGTNEVLSVPAFRVLLVIISDNAESDDLRAGGRCVVQGHADRRATRQCAQIQG